VYDGRLICKQIKSLPSTLILDFESSLLLLTGMHAQIEHFKINIAFTCNLL